MGIIADRLKDSYGFVTDLDMPAVVAEDRLYPCLVRCGGGRFKCPAQNVKHFVDIIEADGRDYVRDVSLLRR